MDGDMDNVMQFAARHTGLDPADAEACVYGQWLGLSGETFLFHGCAPVRVK
jgi:hypothetical protein